jgi:hypothetical protein
VEVDSKNHSQRFLTPIMTNLRTNDLDALRYLTEQNTHCFGIIVDNNVPQIVENRTTRKNSGKKSCWIFCTEVSHYFVYSIVDELTSPVPVVPPPIIATRYFEASGAEGQ